MSIHLTSRRQHTSCEYLLKFSGQRQSQELSMAQNRASVGYFSNLILSIISVRFILCEQGKHRLVAVTIRR